MDMHHITSVAIYVWHIAAKNFFNLKMHIECSLVITLMTDVQPSLQLQSTYSRKTQFQVHVEVRFSEHAQ